MKRGADARQDRGKWRRLTEEPAKGFAASSGYLWRIYKKRRNPEGKQITKTKQSK
jgi:hypothetical protein